MIGLPSYLQEERLELRQYVRSWVRDHQSPSAADFAEAGLIAPHFPRPWGLEADLIDQLVIAHELDRVGLHVPHNTFATTWIGPSLLMAGSPAQQERYIWPMLKGEESWRRLHSEPDAGSDLSRISTRAVPTKTGFVINGQKIWSAQAATADFGALLARTSGTPGDPDGISYFVLPMTTAGITIRPIRDLAGRTTLNEVFLDDVRVPAENLIGRPGDGLKVRRPNYVRPPLSFNPGVGPGPSGSVYDVIDILANPGVQGDLSHRLIDVYIQARTLDSLTLLDAHEQLAFGRCSDIRVDVRRLLHQEHSRTLLELLHDVRESLDCLGDGNTATELDHPDFHNAILQAPLRTVSAGSSDIHRESIAARLFGADSPVLRNWAGEQ
jgi:alkylation response protein AidB-like acyl-CoA dehydrogenase